MGRGVPPKRPNIPLWEAESEVTQNLLLCPNPNMIYMSASTDYTGWIVGSIVQSFIFAVLNCSCCENGDL